MKRNLLLTIICLMCGGIHLFGTEDQVVDIQSDAQRYWRTHFAYNSVQQIAKDKEQVYAVANGKLFSIDPVSEKLTLYNNFSGMHGTEITQIAYDEAREQMLIAYVDGKLDIWHSNKHMQYIADLYNKQMTSSKKCNNITIHENLAYLSMEFGILTFDLEQYEFVDAYYIGPEAKEINVSDVLIKGDSIYAKTSKAIYAAHMGDNIVDYRYWKEHSTSPVVFDQKKGQEYVWENGDIWKVAGVKGVERTMVTNEKIYYLPDGPEVNKPYKMVCQDGRLYVVPGGRWADQYKSPGHVMIYEGEKWVNITQSEIQSKTGKQVTDFTDIILDKSNTNHYFVTSYGTGLYEFEGKELVHHYTVSNSILGSAVASTPDRYTRIDAGMCDTDGVIWVSVAGDVDTTLVGIYPDRSQRGLNLYMNSDSRILLHTPGGLLQDKTNTNRKWVISCRSEAAVILLDDAGTKFDGSDDISVYRKEFLDQEGKIIAPEYYYTISQSPNGDVWIGSSSGPIIIPQSGDFMNNNTCHRLRIETSDGGNLFDTERINAFAWDSKGQIWIGTQSGGVYVLDSNCREVLSCYTSSNSAMPSNSVLSLAYDEEMGVMYIGTSGGLVSYMEDPNAFSSVIVDDENEEEYTYGNMFRWRAHNAFTYVDDIVCMDKTVYGLSAGSLFSVDRESYLVKSYTKLDGLSASKISHIAYNNTLKNMLLTYANGQIDVINSEGDIHNISDLYLKQMNASKQVNDICIYGEKAYLAMSFGILVINMRKLEIEDTYYIGSGSSEVDVRYITVLDSMVYAISLDKVYHAHLNDNLMDYAYWKTFSLPKCTAIYGMRAYNEQLYVVLDRKLYVREGNVWKYKQVNNIESLALSSEELYLLPYNKPGIAKMDSLGGLEWMLEDEQYYALEKDGDSYWLGSSENGLIHYTPNSETRETYYPDGPSSNFAYKLRFFGDKLYMLPGGRWANQLKRLGEVMIFENDTWRNIKNSRLLEMATNVLGEKHQVLDLMNVAQDPKDANHYFVTSYGTGMYEFMGDSIVAVHLPDNSELMSAVLKNPKFYTRTDALQYDDMGNLWILNMSGEDSRNVHVITPNGDWSAYNIYYEQQIVPMHTAGDLLIDNRNSEWKWIPLLRANTGLILLDDNNTPTNPNDDHATYRNEWIDQNNNQILPTAIYTIAQDHDGVLWVGTQSGIFVIPSNVDFATSNACRRIIIPRNDGTNLGDYLLNNEQINEIKIDGANRIWVGTATSGVFLLRPVEDDVNNPNYYVETVAHFTIENSILPSNEILSIAIQESTGEVFIGTGGGLVSYMSDATTPQEDYSKAYVYPNPVTPMYQGYITFKELVSDTELRILDPNGNLVRIIHSEGGSAVWDGKNSSGNRVGSGVYTVLCNTRNGEQSGIIKVMILN